MCVAGRSRRMGAFKPLLPVCGRPMVQQSIASALLGGASGVVCVTGHRAEDVEAVVTEAFGDRVIVARNEAHATTDMLRSIQVGCAALPNCDAFYLLPGDMPVVRPRTFRVLADAWDERRSGVCFPTLDGHRKHPPLIDARLAPAIRAYQGEQGLRGFWNAHQALCRDVPVTDPGTWVDLDTAQDYLSCIARLNHRAKEQEVDEWRTSAVPW
ncbi:nucleotidyltransferase family protein [Olsenella sp. YH-ols2217]|uniref:Nucleotidyltransferase family protein n=1 Tax=Kribbibacterium absianum TaxID=3044210 RepID=A0ABT6ZHV5_9ACTN|nr:nucleotidyltransferase family protein [Olsenella sp. YH-ols2217]MDJ1121136.1 nucleotidyltransferase family protein [Olsenella sp. YH-ols2216]MDJ1128627.1 nucleotidyltransferase family protein [Olsenella sp. YH-ols2217]